MKRQPSKTPEAKPAEPAPQSHHVVENVPKYRQCPACWGTKRGVGQSGWWRRINGTLVKRQYKCDCCGMDWTVLVRTHSSVEKIEYQDVEVQHGEIDLDTR